MTEPIDTAAARELADAVKKCHRCRAVLPLSEFYAEKRNRDGLKGSCKACVNEQIAAWRAANPEKVKAMDLAYRSQLPKGYRAEISARWQKRHRSRRTEYLREYRASNPLKMAAHNAVRKAIERGDLKRAESCERCGASGCRIEGSHWDYNRPLDVEWLCVPCHRRKDEADFGRRILDGEADDAR